MLPQIVESLVFSRRAAWILGEEGLRALIGRLLENPREGVVIPGGGGIRKLRVAVEGRGRRGGARVIYFYADRWGRVLLLDIYLKNRRTDVTAAELARMKAAIATEFAE